MVDPGARREAALAVRRLLSGQLTNWQFEDRYEGELDWDDPAIGAVFYSVWCCYSDFPEYRITNPRPAYGWFSPAAEERGVSRAWRRVMARWILFLRTRLEYRWPPIAWPGIRPLDTSRIGCLGRALGRLKRIEREEAAFFARGGHHDVWPFFTRDEFDRTLRQPVYLAGGC